MQAEISIKCFISTDYEKAKKEKDNGKIVWTIFTDNDKNYFEDKVVKKKDAGYIIMDGTNTEIILFRREKWSKK